jgi:hydrophobic/amphiphilic exporter-1 (mainly G- bacteria), HAE1 family
MNLSEIFIRRSVMTTLVMLTIAFFGVLAYRAMPVSDLPDVDYPTIEVSVDYPGASPETIANNVVVPLEQQFATINGIRSISSTSYTSSASIVLQFDLDKSIDLAAPDVQSAINAASAQLPQNLPYAPTYSKVNPTATPVLFFTLYSETMTRGNMYDYAHSVIGQRLNIVEGVSQVETYGVPYAVRVQVDPQKLAARNIGIDQIGTAIQNANVYLPVGTLYGQKREFTIDVDGQIYEGEKYNSLIMKTDSNSGSIVRLKDVGRSFDSIQNDKLYVQFFKDDFKEDTVGLAIQKQPGANTLATIDRINTVLPTLEHALPGSVKLYRMYDQSEYILASVDEVKFTLFIAMILVIIVIFLYLGKFIDTAIPSLAIPMSILGTFIVMYMLGYTIDILSLLAITLSIGFLVDDAIVVLENIVRHVEMGETPLQAALNGSKEISFTILSMTLCLASIFIPLVFMAGIIGRILHEFAMTIVTAVLISGFISLSLTPLLCSKLIPPHKKEKQKSKVARFSEQLNEKMLAVYRPSLEWALKHRKWVFLFGIASVVFTLILVIKIPKDFIPGDDIGFIEAFTMTPDGTSPFEVGRIQKRYAEIGINNPNIDSIVAIGGSPQDNEGIMYLRLKDPRKREPMKKVVKELYDEFKCVTGANIFLRPIPLINLQVGTTTSKADYQFTMQSLNADDLYKYAPIMESKMKTLKGFAQVNSDLDITQPQLSIEILRDKASMLGITALQIENSLNLAFADSNLSPINEPQNQYYVIMEVLPHFYENPSKLNQLWLTSTTTGNLVPLSSVVKMTETIGPLTINHFDGLPSATVSFNVVNIPLQTALNELEALSKEVLPPTVTGVVQGSASIFKSSFANLQFLLIITFFLVYVILGILYENFYPPLTVMSTLPPAALGGLLSLIICNEILSLYAVVGLIMLLGIVMKNGIIMIDFANDSRENQGKNAHDAIFHACVIRFRPILMTTFSALMGAVPIALGFGGTAAESRKALGIVIVGGLLFSQVLTLYFTPVTYTYVEALREWVAKKRKKTASTEESPS